MKAKNFKRFELKSFLVQALSEKGFTLPTEIQERLIPAIKNGQDVIGQSQTGTGKTLAFLLPIIHRIDPRIQHVQAIITAPTRELATQLHNELTELLSFATEDEALQTKLLVGGTDRLRAIDRLQEQPHIIVGTVGRITDFVRSGVLHIHKATMLIVDEADQMLDMGFIEDVDHIASKMDINVQMMVFSATIPKKLQPFLRKYMKNPRHVHVQPHDATAKEIEHRLIPLRHRDKLSLIVELTKNITPFLAIIFTNTIEEADEVANAMLREGLNTERLHGGLQPRQRRRVMRLVQEAKVQYVVATDLAARGIHIDGVSHIINYNFPTDLDFYIHRTGRTARAGADGVAYSLFEQRDDYAVKKLHDRGIRFTYYDFKNGQWEQLKQPPLGAPGKRKRTKESLHPAERRKQNRKLRRPKRVTPGYKKKAARREQEINRRKNRSTRNRRRR